VTLSRIVEARPRQQIGLAAGALDLAALIFVQFGNDADVPEVFHVRLPLVMTNQGGPQQCEALARFS
jgi:hypothetical protein